MPLSYKILQLLTPEFFIPYFQYVVFIVIGTGILFSIIFHVGVKEHPRDCSVEFVTSSCKRSAANWKAWFREPSFYQVLIYLVIFIYVLSSVPSLPNSCFCLVTERSVAWRDKRGCEGDYSVPMLLKRATGRGERKVEKCVQMRELEMK